MLFRFLSKSSGRFAYAGPMINAGSALIRSRSGMARDGRALSNKAQLEQPDTCALRQLGARVWLRCCACLNGGSVKGASPLVFICPLHINIKNN